MFKSLCSYRQLLERKSFVQSFKWYQIIMQVSFFEVRNVSLLANMSFLFLKYRKKIRESKCLTWVPSVEHLSHIHIPVIFGGHKYFGGSRRVCVRQCYHWTGPFFFSFFYLLVIFLFLSLMENSLSCSCHEMMIVITSQSHHSSCLRQL